MEKMPIEKQVEILTAAINKMHTEIDDVQQLLLKTSNGVPEIVYMKFRMMAKACSTGADAIQEQLPKGMVDCSDKLIGDLNFVAIAEVKET